MTKIIITGLLITLVGCSNNPFVEEARKTTTDNERIVQQKEENAEELKNKQDAILEELEKPLNEVVQNNDLDTLNTIESKEFIVKLEYTDPNELARHVGEILFDFQNGAISPEEFYKFMLVYGSKNVQNTLTDKESAIDVYRNVQALYKEKNQTLESYVLSEVVKSSSKKEAYFYRKVKTSSGDQYYISTLVLEGDVWKFEEDSPSPPFEMKDIQESKGGTDNADK